MRVNWPRRLRARGEARLPRLTPPPVRQGPRSVAESLPALFAFKQRIKSQLREVPHVEEDEPAVCAWYPSARKVVIWNLSTEARTLTVADGERRIPLRLGPLQAAAAEVAVRGERPAQ